MGEPVEEEGGGEPAVAGPERGGGRGRRRTRDPSKRVYETCGFGWHTLFVGGPPMQ